MLVFAFVVAALVCFILAAIQAESKVALTPLGLACAAAAVITYLWPLVMGHR